LRSTELATRLARYFQVGRHPAALSGRLTCGFRGAWREPDINVEHHKAPADERPEPTARRKFMGAGLGAGPGVATVVLLAASTAASAPVRAKSSRVRHCTYAAAPGLEP
jgi:hypothetical protein